MRQTYLLPILYTCSMRFGMLSTAILAVILSIGCGSSDSRTVLLRLKAKPGDVYTLEYTTNSKYDQPATADSAATHASSDITVKKSYSCTKAEDTKTTWDVKTEDAQAKFEGALGQQAAIAALGEKGKTTVYVRDERNLLLDQPKVSPIEFEFPIEAVHIGDSWRSEARMQGAALSMTYTVVGIEKIDGKDAVVITGSHEGAGDVEALRPVKAWYDLDSGWPIKGECEYILHSGDSKLRVFYSMKRK